MWRADLYGWKPGDAWRRRANWMTVWHDDVTLSHWCVTLIELKLLHLLSLHSSYHETYTICRPHAICSPSDSYLLKKITVTAWSIHKKRLQFPHTTNPPSKIETVDIPILIGDDKFIESVIFDPMFTHYTHPTSTTPQSIPQYYDHTPHIHPHIP